MLVIYAVYFLYYFADMATSANTMVKQTESRTEVHIFLIALILLLGVFYLFQLKWKLDDPFRLGFFLMIVWCVITDFIVGASFWGIATHVGLLVLFYLIYYFGGHYINTPNRYRLVLVLECVLWAVTMYYAVQAYINFNEYHDGDRDSVLNMAYNVLVFVPFLLQIKNRPIKITTLVISAAYIIVSLKRGAIITFVVMMVVYFWLSRKHNKGKGVRITKKQTCLLIIGVAAFCIAAGIVDNKLGGALSKRFSLESLMFGSTRGDLYAAAWKNITNRSFFSVLIGTGSGSSLSIIGSGVHNELLEFLFSYGMIGMLLYVVTLIAGIRRGRQIYKANNDQYLPKGKVYAMGLVYMILVGLFGSAVFSHMFFHIMLAMGMANSPAMQEAGRSSQDGQ